MHILQPRKMGLRDNLGQLLVVASFLCVLVDSSAEDGTETCEILK